MQLQPIAPIRDRKIRIAMVGCGRISANHIKAIALEHRRAELVALCDPQRDRLEKAAALLGDASPGLAATPPARFCSDAELLSAVRAGRLDVDLVVLATPSGLHPEQTIAAAEAGLHVCTEKPMATRWTDGQAMVRACDAAGVRLFVVKQNRCNSTLQLVRRQLQAKRFGQLAMVTVNVFWQRPQSYYDQDAWRGTRAMDGGALMNQASHYVDLLDWLVGPVACVSASIATIGRAIEVEDTAALQLRWRCGALGTMAVTMLTYPKNMEGSITLLGETGTVRVGGAAVNRIEQWHFADHSPDDELVESASYHTTNIYGFGHPPYYANILDVLQGKDVPLCDGHAGLRSLELLTATYRSAREERTVYLSPDV
ncbi:Gfo/Idh/MocA family protein [Synechococcus sp. CBW1004]|uniref:Gfo/Idh/MocA family protein n=1 Tax=Synechococcus sp. CBW1004 TaxID=1353136 RepID=UPI0018CDBEA7|nr:Gfo/Idh/MocA family oxidoreductase [Synechococcus sp. CBW1004]QPN62471.1 Gfo/Idh/MocA family oxidoreductase [Synechococcus sp. CBW1004]